uniref:Uncharacterized protein n=1 Tax=Globisporangium ultimum (strain ATCC 200006 / CBS 805.95 / DAOM BR144) TaxID=431595 RepID=K3WX08_GLOUD
MVQAVPNRSCMSRNKHDGLDVDVRCRCQIHTLDTACLIIQGVAAGNVHLAVLGSWMWTCDSCGIVWGLCAAVAVAGICGEVFAASVGIDERSVAGCTLVSPLSFNGC